MSSFLNGATLNTLTGLFQRHFETFGTGNGNYVTIIKEPIKQINTSIDSENVLVGYENDEFNNTSITYIPQTGVFPCMAIYPHVMNQKSFTELKFKLNENECMVKVQSEAKDYIMNGKNELAQLNGLNYTINNFPQIQNYFGSVYYYFKLTATQ